MGMNRLRATLAAVAGALALPGAAHAADAYQDSVLADSPLTYLRMGEPAGAAVANDTSPNERHATAAGAVAFGTDGPFSDAGNAVRLGRTGTLTATVPVSSGSVELWINPDRPAKSTEPTIVAHGNPATTGWALKIGARRKLLWTSGSHATDTRITLGTGIWTALTVTWGAGKVSFYRNGASSAKPVNIPAAPASGGALVIGGGGFAGRIDEVALYAKVLSAAGVSEHFASTKVPGNTAPPAVAGTPAVGATLTATAGTWTGATGAPTYQWQRCDADGEVCVDVAGAAAATYTLPPGAACSVFQVVETVGNAYGKGSATSGATAVVTPCNPATQQPAPLNEVPPAIEGTPAIGATLTVQRGEWMHAGGAPSYRWQRCDAAGAACVDVAGATGTTYVPAAGEECATLRVVEIVRNATGSDDVASDETAPVAPCDADPGTGGGGGTGGDTGGGTGGGATTGGGTGGGGTTGGGTGGSTGGGTGGGAGTTTPIGAVPATVKDLSETKAPAGCLKVVAGRKKARLRRVGTLRIAIAGNTCLTGPVGASFKARKGVRLQRVRYRLDGKRLKRATGARFAARVSLAAGTHTLSVRVQPRAGKARSVKLRLRLAVA
jgi:hypothetical protein